MTDLALGVLAQLRLWIRLWTIARSTLIVAPCQLSMRVNAKSVLMDLFSFAGGPEFEVFKPLQKEEGNTFAGRLWPSEAHTSCVRLDIC